VTQLLCLFYFTLSAVAPDGLPRVSTALASLLGDAATVALLGLNAVVVVIVVLFWMQSGLSPKMGALKQRRSRGKASAGKGGVIVLQTIKIPPLP
jgi:hypothetical protein